MKRSILFLGALFSTMALFAQDDMETRWPAEYEPAKSKFFVRNEIEISADPQVIWDVLVQAEAWAAWYKGAKNVEVSTSGQGELTTNGVFTWKTMGLNFESTIREFEPPYRLSWESRKKSIQGYHAWLIIPTATGAKVITEESQNGWLTFFEKTFQGKKLRRLHDVWLAELKKMSETP